MVIYADVLFLVNFIFDYAALILLGKLMKLYIHHLRIAAAGVVGAMGTVLIFCFGAWHVFLKIALAIIMILCAYGFHGKKTLQIFAAFGLIITALSGAVMLLVSVIPTGADSVIKNGIVYFDLPGGLLLALMLVSYPTVCLVSKGIRARKNRTVYRTVIERAGRSVTVNALFDSGNKLKEPITGRPVVVAEWSAVEELFEEKAAFEELTDKAEKYRLWIIPYKSLGGNGRIFAFLADRIQADKHVTERVFIGVTNQKFTGEYQAVLNADLI